MANYLSQKCKFGPCLVQTLSTEWTNEPIGTLTVNPAIITFQNDTTQTVFLDDDGSGTNGKYFISGERMVVDCNSDKTKDSDVFMWPIGTTFTATTTNSGTGTFSISVITAK